MTGNNDIEHVNRLSTGMMVSMTNKDEFMRFIEWWLKAVEDSGIGHFDIDIVARRDNQYEKEHQCGC